MNHLKISYGENLTTTGQGSLQRINEEQLFERISRPGADLQRLCKQLQEVRRVSREGYDRLKRRLPFFCGSLFEGDHRKLEHFTEAHYFVLDLDDCRRDEAQFRQLCQKLQTDERVLMRFTSPSGTGLKLVFSLAKPITSAREFSAAYRAFAYAFANEHELGDYVDFRTHDATRVCFLNADPEAHYNRLAEDLDWPAFAPAVTTPAGAATGKPATATKTRRPEAGQGDETEAPDYKAILAKLKPSPRNLRYKREPFVPETLEAIIDPVKQALGEKDIEVEMVRDIQYGKKWLVVHGAARGEINVFYGKRGFSVVKSPKRGTHPDLNTLAALLINNAIAEAQDSGLSEALGERSADQTEETAP